MKPLFRYFGSKWKLAPLYGRPRRDIVIEPFAGAAGFSCYHNAPKVILVEKNDRVAAIWKWLISADRADVMALDPDVTDVRDTDYPQPVRDFISTWFGRGSHGAPMPKMPPSNRIQKEQGARRFWCETVRNRVADCIHLVDGWEIIHGDYTAAPDVEAHWHIDPPYQHRGHHYVTKGIDYAALADWCRSRRGCGEVCEASGADWLPFVPLKTRYAQNNAEYTEVVCRLESAMNAGTQ